MRGTSEPKNSKIRIISANMYETKTKARDDRYKRFTNKSGPVVDLRLKYGNAMDLVE